MDKYVSVDFVNLIKIGDNVHCTYRCNNCITTFEVHLFDLYDIINYIYKIERKKIVDLEEVDDND